jgi:hypothetical protein
MHRQADCLAVGHLPAKSDPYRAERCGDSIRLPMFRPGSLEQQTQSQQAALQQMQQLLQQILQAEDTQAALRQYADYIDEAFLSVLGANIQAAQKRGSSAAASSSVIPLRSSGGAGSLVVMTLGFCRQGIVGAHGHRVALPCDAGRLADDGKRQPVLPWCQVVFDLQKQPSFWIVGARLNRPDSSCQGHKRY